MRLRNWVLVFILLAAGGWGWMDYQGRRTETLFTASGVQVRVLSAEAQGGFTKIVEPNGKINVFSDRTRKQELSRIAATQEKLSTRLDYSYHRVKRFIQGLGQ